MKRILVSVTGEVQASAQTVYTILADYQQHHPRILPGSYFTNLVVEAGGLGAGTVFQAQMNVFGSKRTFRMRVAEPEPGRVLSETDLDTGLITTFTVAPIAAERCTVTIATEWQACAGFGGWVQRLTMPSFMRRIYRAELQQLDEYAQAQGSSSM